MGTIYPAIWWAWSPRMEVVPLAQDPMGSLGMCLISLVVYSVNVYGDAARDLLDPACADASARYGAGRE